MGRAEGKRLEIGEVRGKKKGASGETSGEWQGGRNEGGGASSRRETSGESGGDESGETPPRCLATSRISVNRSPLSPLPTRRSVLPPPPPPCHSPLVSPLATGLAPLISSLE